MSLRIAGDPVMTKEWPAGVQSTSYAWLSKFPPVWTHLLLNVEQCPLQTPVLRWGGGEGVMYVWKVVGGPRR